MRQRNNTRFMIQQYLCLIAFSVICLLFLHIGHVTFHSKFAFPWSYRSIDSNAAAVSLHHDTGGYRTDNAALGCKIDESSAPVVEMKYDSFDGALSYRFLVSLHDPEVDQVISKGILKGLFGPKDKYGSVEEIHSICEHSKGSYLLTCGSKHVFVEVGSAIGMVSLYAASRRMKTYAFDPLSPNIRRMHESQCLNGRKHCLENFKGNSTKNTTKDVCNKPSDHWGGFSPTSFSLFCNLVGSQTDHVGHVVESEPGNLAATMRGGGSFRNLVTTVTLDTMIPEEIELLLLTCQGFEYDVRYYC